MFAFFCGMLTILHMKWRRVYHVGAIAAQFQAKVGFVCEILCRSFSRFFRVEDFTCENHQKCQACMKMRVTMVPQGCQQQRANELKSTHFSVQQLEPFILRILPRAKRSSETPHCVVSSVGS